MRLTLIAPNHPELEPIRLTEGMLPIGRDEEPFASYPGDLSVQLSARHARVFLEQGNFYVSDLGSSNGSLLNGKPVHESPMPIKAGDVLALGELQFIAGIDADAGTGGVQPELILDPMDGDADLTRLVITRFPLLIGKSSEPMVQFGERHPNELLFLSRRHAHLYTRDGRVFVEDLGSTNGTYVSAKRLEDRPHCLEDGETLAFGGDFFSYRVGLPGSDATPPGAVEAATDDDAGKTRILSREGTPRTTPVEVEPESEPKSPPEPESAPRYEAGKTTFVSSPTSFLEIFCSDEDTADPGDAAGKDEPKNRVGGAKIGPAGASGRSGAAGSRTWIIALLLLGIAALIGAAVYLFPKGQEQELKELIKADRLEQAARLGDRWLGGTQDKGSLQPLATEALMKYVAVPWMRHVKQGEFAEAAGLLEQAKPLTGNNPVGADMLEVLGWAGRLEAFFAERKGAASRIAIYRDEQAIRDIVDYWESDRIGKQRVLDRITVYVPDFSEFSSRTQSHLRALRTSEAIYLKAIGELSAEIEKGLRESAGANAADRGKRLDALAERIRKFSVKYPNVVGLEALEQDLSAYRKLALLLDEKDPSSLSAHLESKSPRTPPFQRHREWMLREHLPPDAFSAEFGEALRAWRAGEAEQAIGLLTRIEANDWNGLARTRRKHFETVFSAHRKLDESKATPGHGDRIVAFHRMLNADDSYYRELLSADFAAEKKSIIELADRALVAARGAWDAYLDQGGIDGGMRIERKLSDAYKAQAGRLMEALRQVNEGGGLYSSLGETPGAAERSLASEIRLEVKRQRSWLEELSSIMGPRVTRGKLALLSEFPAEEKAE